MFPLGLTIVKYTSMDSAGNFVEEIFSVTVKDNESPIIHNIPSDITAYTLDGAPTASVTWTEPYVIDNSGLPTTLVSSHNSGTLFAVGTTTVTYTATDSADNIATADFGITVIQPFWGTWGSWSDCNTECGWGTQTRTRTCEMQGTGSCPGSASESTSCILRDWCRADGRCGPSYPSVNGQEGRCIAMCCSTVAWCGQTSTHCSFQLHRDYRCCTGLTCPGPC
ncbi:hyalin-like [Amphiura filiformis]|uniref:hyalin-like n=1 Tax=Amphiura filiformis TaxID=82378 RepID=UPI003B21402A